MKLCDQLRRLLQIGRQHREVVAYTSLQTRGDRREGPEITAERNQLCGIRGRRKPLPQDFERSVRTPVHDENDFQRRRQLPMKCRQFRQQPIQIRLVPVDRNDERKHTAGRPGWTQRCNPLSATNSA
jgi:hypothetical protein